MNIHLFVRRLALLSSLVSGPAALAAPVLIDFENYANTGVHATVQSNGFTFAPASGTVAIAANGSNCSPNCAANGTSAFVVGGTGLNPPTTAPVTMTGPVFSFRLIGLDFAELSHSAATNWSAESIVMTGWLLGGGSVTQTLTIDGLNDGPGGTNDFQAALLDAIWGTSELTALQFAGFDDDLANRAFQLDNIALDVTRVAAIPEPASWTLAALAILAAGWQRRRRRNA